MMSNIKINSKIKMIMLVWIIAFVTYNIVLFVLCGFTGHGGAFWTSYVFMLIAFGSLAFSGYLLKLRDFELKDWLFGYPILKHCTIYSILELISSIIFMVLDSRNCPWGIAFAVQIIILAVHFIFLIPCFLAKATIDDVENKVKNATSYIRLLQVDVEMIAEKATEPSVKEAFKKLAEQVRYSDPMSNEKLLEIEKQITQQVNNADSCVALGDMGGALQCCDRASLLLVERNKKCKVLK